MKNSPERSVRPKRLGPLLRSILAVSKVSQVTIAKEMKVTESYISRVISTDNSSYENPKLRILEILGYDAFKEERIIVRRK